MMSISVLMTIVFLFARTFGQTNICQPNPCRNDGICHIVSANTYRCTCREGHYGPNCEFGNGDEMEKAGFCPAVGTDTSGTCAEECEGDSSCPGEMKCCFNGCGHSCIAPAAVSVDACHSNPCSSGGTCVATFDGYGCFCLAGYVGKRCEYSQAVAVRPGSCPKTEVRDGVFGMCSDDCTDDWSCPFPLRCCSNGCGRVCTVPVTTGDVDWCMSNPCVNGGMCLTNSQGYACICPDQRFVGSRCEEILSSPQPSSPELDKEENPEDVTGNQELPTTIIAVVVPCTVVIAAILVLTGVFMYKRSQRNQTSKSDGVSVNSQEHIIKGPATVCDPHCVEQTHWVA
ncbi:delta-like protein 1 [Acanthaster planci]|uniref:Delta-like protein 1 n=1 Tax=Acanthaster planci TaxID=133434 RepID=A0A8B7YWF4_ACAPL|nr:delta-like protein 1 [Acanthaster planci]